MWRNDELEPFVGWKTVFFETEEVHVARVLGEGGEDEEGKAEEDFGEGFVFLEGAAEIWGGQERCLRLC